MSFGASYDSTTKAVSSLVLILLVVVAAVTHSTMVTAIFAFVLVAAFAWAPTGYAISDGAIVIARLIGDVRIPVDGIRDVRAATADDFRGCIRLFGSGGLFGYYGIFRTSKLGKCAWYMTHRDRTIVIVGDSGTAVVSPDDVDGFVAAVRRVCPSGALRPQAAPAAQPDTGRMGLGWMKVAVLIPVTTVVAFSLLYSPGPPAYTLTPQSLTIHDRFYPVTLNAASVDVAHVRVIDLGSDTDWKPVARTNGFANARYHSGWFRVASGKVVRLYRTDATSVVLLPPKGDGTPVLLETKEPGKFRAEVLEKWAVY